MVHGTAYGQAHRLHVSYVGVDLESPLSMLPFLFSCRLVAAQQNHAATPIPHGFFGAMARVHSIARILFAGKCRVRVAQQPLGAGGNFGGPRNGFVDNTLVYALGWHCLLGIPRASRCFSPSCTIVHFVIISPSLPPPVGLPSLITSVFALYGGAMSPTHSWMAEAIAEEQHRGFRRSRRGL